MIMMEFKERVDSLKIKATATYGNRGPVADDMENMDPWTVVLRYGKKRLTVPFFMGVGHNGKEPDVYDVLSCLVSDAYSVENSRSFEEWASELGYNPDSRKAEKIFKACERTRAMLKKFLGEQYEAFLWETEGY